jgi:hypothetical protein
MFGDVGVLTGPDTCADAADTNERLSASANAKGRRRMT